MDILDRLVRSCFGSFWWFGKQDGGDSKYIDYAPTRKWKYNDQNLMRELTAASDVIQLSDDRGGQISNDMKLQLHDSMIFNDEDDMFTRTSDINRNELVGEITPHIAQIVVREKRCTVKTSKDETYESVDLFPVISQNSQGTEEVEDKDVGNMIIDNENIISPDESQDENKDDEIKTVIDPYVTPISSSSISLDEESVSPDQPQEENKDDEAETVIDPDIAPISLSGMDEESEKMINNSTISPDELQEENKADEIETVIDPDVTPITSSGISLDEESVSPDEPQEENKDEAETVIDPDIAPISSSGMDESEKMINNSTISPDEPQEENKDDEIETVIDPDVTPISSSGISLDEESVSPDEPQEENKSDEAETIIDPDIAPISSTGMDEETGNMINNSTISPDEPQEENKYDDAEMVIDSATDPISLSVMDEESEKMINNSTISPDEPQEANKDDEIETVIDTGVIPNELSLDQENNENSTNVMISEVRLDIVGSNKDVHEQEIEVGVDVDSENTQENFSSDVSYKEEKGPYNEVENKLNFDCNEISNNDLEKIGDDFIGNDFSRCTIEGSYPVEVESTVDNSTTGE